MPRPLRLDFPGALFHNTNRGVDRATIFIDDSDRIAFLKILDTACARYGGVCLAYCLMGNHYHTFLKSIDGRMSSLMQHLNGSYGRWFNRRRGRSGPLFEGRFRSQLVDRESYFLEVVRYIELNPCRAGLIEDPFLWEWSSLRARMGIATGPDCLDVDQALEIFSTDRREARGRYRDFILDGLSARAKDGRLGAETILGTTAFVRYHAERAQDLARGQSVPRHQRTAGRPALEDLLSRVADRETRRRQARIAFLHYGYPMTAIARRLGVHYATISRWIRQP